MNSIENCVTKNALPALKTEYFLELDMSISSC